MVETDEDICNEALALVGVTKAIDDLDGDSTEARVCLRFYARARDATLESFPWSFATRRAILSARGDIDRDDWAYVYALPADCLAPRSIPLGDSRSLSVDDTVEFAVEIDSDLSTKILLTDADDAVLVYTAKITNPGVFPDLFVDAVTWNLAARIAVPLIKQEKGRDATKLALGEYYRCLNEAMSSESRKGFRLPPITPGLAVRGVLSR